jgi:hypothetical protein
MACADVAWRCVESRCGDLEGSRIRETVLLKADAKLREPRLIFHRLANREQEDGTLVLRVRQKELSHVVVEKGQPRCTEALGISG